MSKHLKRPDAAAIALRNRKRRKLRGLAFLAVGALIAGPAIAATIPDGHLEYVANLRLIETARQIGEAGTNPTTWEGDSSWRIDASNPDNPIREIRMTWPRDAAVLPFNLFSHLGDLTGDAGFGGPEGTDLTGIEGAGLYRIIVPGDYGSTVVRVHNDGPTAGILTARLDRNLLHNEDRSLGTAFDANGRPIPGASIVPDGTDDVFDGDLAYEHLFINGVPASYFVAQTGARISFDGMVEIPIDAGGYVDLPFDWSFFAFDGDAYYREPHNIGNEPYTRADFRLNLDLVGQVTQLTVFKAIAGPDLPATWADGIVDSDDWQIQVFAVGHQHDDGEHSPSVEFSGLYQTAAMAGFGLDTRWAQYGNINASSTFGLLVNPGNVGPDGGPARNPMTGEVLAVQPQPALYTAVLLEAPAPAAGGVDFLLDQAAKNRDWINASFDAGGSLYRSQITALERDEFGEAIGSLQCVLLGPFDGDGARTIVDAGFGGWATGPYGGRNGLVQVPDNHHAVCEKVSQTSLVSVEKIVQTFNAYGVLVGGGALPTEWQINITPVYLADDEIARITSDGTLVTAPAENPVGAGLADLNFTQDALAAVPAAVGPTQALSDNVRIVPGQTYRIDLIAPENRIVGGYQLVDVYLTPALPATNVVPLVATGSTISLDTFRARGSLAPNTGGVMASGLLVSIEDARIDPVWGAAFVPYGTTLAVGASVAQPGEIPTASWILSFDELTANTITFVSSNHPSLQPTAPPPVPGPHTPGRTITLTETGADLALGIIALAVVGGAIWLLASNRRRKSTENAAA